MPTATGPTVSSSTARALYSMTRTLAYAETIRLVPPSPGGVSVEGFKRVLAELARLGVGRRAPSLGRTAGAQDFEKAAEVALSALEESPVPAAEWRPMSDILSDELAGLVGISASSLARYRSGERITPDPVAARLHVVAMVVSDLSGSYNDFGIRRWFQRPRTALGGRAPGEILSGHWNPDEDEVIRVRDLARSLLGAAGA
ncbi:hypothetical protein [Kocuria marina]|uniref:hypothetical protein n=1 Tax=Kocuria marina TaxID=223184 RepID=UPI0019D07091|nr:hypothetical protein [Kocuria indica]MBN6812943.1 hypothetical protein [Kocuria indica]MBN6844668.1 hypothetical protein [Kocuria indica]